VTDEPSTTSEPSGRDPIIVPAEALPARSAPPRDWRWAVGLVGRVLIVAGLLLFGFVAYQLWGTNIQEARAQDSLRTKFAAVLAKSTAPAGAITTTSTGPASTSTIASTSTTAGTTVETTVPETAVPDTTVAPGAAPAGSTIDPTQVAEGDPIARIEIPKIGVDKTVVSGVSVGALRKGPGHFPDTPFPGERGNAAIAGHRTTFGAPFYRVDELAPGDDIIVPTVAGRFVYKVSTTLVVDPTDYDVVANSDTPTLTLVSCHPRLSASKRIIIKADLDIATSPTPAEPAPRAAVLTTQPGDTASTLPGDAGSETAATGEGAGSATADAFHQGWFSEPVALWSVGLWALVLVAIALGGRLIGRRTHRRWLGWLSAAIPFVVTLYFFYENVSRLLPPNI
jgi:sortase A